jgi:hypothetical protein
MRRYAILAAIQGAFVISARTGCAHLCDYLTGLWRAKGVAPIRQSVTTLGFTDVIQKPLPMRVQSSDNRHHGKRFQFKERPARERHVPAVPRRSVDDPTASLSRS